VRARKSTRLPVVLSRQEARRLLAAQTNNQPGLVARLPYGSELPLTEALQLRIQGLDFAPRQILVRASKGDKDRHTLLPESLIADPQQQIAAVRHRWKQNQNTPNPGVSLPEALARKYPQAFRQFNWYYLFPSSRISRDPRSGRRLRPCTPATYKKRSARPPGWPIFPKRSPRTPCVPPSPLTCSRQATLSALCRNCSATKLALSLSKGPAPQHD
jgi:integrase